MFGHVPGSRASIYIAAVWEDRHLHNESVECRVCPIHRPPFPPSIAECGHHMAWYIWEDLFGWFCHPGNVLTLSMSCKPPACWLWGGGGLDRVLMLCKYCSAIDMTQVWYQCCSQQSTALYGLLQGKITPSQPDPEHQQKQGRCCIM